MGDEIAPVSARKFRYTPAAAAVAAPVDVVAAAPAVAPAVAVYYL